MMNITDAIWRNAYAYPKRTCLIYNDVEISYDELMRASILVAENLAKHGIGHGHCVAVTLQDAPAYLATFLGVATLGAALSPLSDEIDSRTKKFILDRVKAKLLIYPDDDLREEIADIGIPALNSKEIFAASTSEKHFWAQEKFEASNTPLFLPHSSGTTGIPKTVVFTHEQLFLRVAMAPESSDFEERLLIFRGLHPASSLRPILASLCWGNTAIFSEPHSPELFFDLAYRKQPLCASISTGTAHKLVGHAISLGKKKAQIACASIKKIYVNGAKVPPSLITALSENIAPKVIVTCGSTEMGQVSSITNEKLKEHPGVVGRLYPWIQGQAVDDDNKPLPTGENGFLRFRTPQMVKEYLEDPENTAKYFRDGWFYSGDIGSVDSAGFLKIEGRNDHRIIVRGQKIYAETLESLMLSIPGVLDCAFVNINSGDSEGPMTVAAVCMQNDLTQDSLIEQCQSILVNWAPDSVIVLDDMPKNAAGKTDRSVLIQKLNLLTQNNS